MNEVRERKIGIIKAQQSGVSVHPKLPAVPRLHASFAYCLRHISSLQLTSNNNHVKIFFVKPFKVFFCFIFGIKKSPINVTSVRESVRSESRFLLCRGKFPLNHFVKQNLNKQQQQIV